MLPSECAGLSASTKTGMLRPGAEIVPDPRTFLTCTSLFFASLSLSPDGTFITGDWLGSLSQTGVLPQDLTEEQYLSGGNVVF